MRLHLVCSVGLAVVFVGGGLGATSAAAVTQASDASVRVTVGAMPMALPQGPTAVADERGAELLSPASPTFVSSCDSVVVGRTSWSANCRVTSGRSGSITDCSDGTRIVGPAVGVGYWKFGGTCSGHGSLVRWGWYDV